MEHGCAFGSYLGLVDPWYNCHIRSLGVTIPELAKKVAHHNHLHSELHLLSECKEFIQYCSDHYHHTTGFPIELPNKNKSNPV